MAQLYMSPGKGSSQDLSCLQLVGVVSLAELAHHGHPGEAPVTDLGGGLLDLSLPKGIDLLAPEVYGPVQDDALPQIVIFGVGSRSRYEHQGHRIGLALGDHIGDEGGGEYHPLHLGRVHAGHQLVECSQ